MRALLDTHAFLWWNLNHPELSENAREFISDGRNEIFVSAATAWEIAIKYGKKRLTLPEAPELYMAKRLKSHQFVPLPIQVSHAVEVHKLPSIHNDPFDRLLIVQSQLENMPLLTNDGAIKQYNVQVIW